MPRGLAADLRGWLEGRPRGKRVFDLPTRLAWMLRTDLSDVGIEYRDGAGRVLDFHAFRHTFITNLARGGVFYPKVAQQLARHSTITLTMDRYSHTAIGEAAAALSALPDLSSSPDRQRQRATGTYDAQSRPADMSAAMSELVASRASRPASGCTESVKDADGREEDPSTKGASKGSKTHFPAPSCTTGVDGNRTHQEPRERPLNGFEGRGTHQASGHPQRHYGCRQKD